MAQEKSVRERRGDRYSFTNNYVKAINTYSRTKNLSVDGQRALAVAYHKMDQNQLSEETYAALIGAGIGIIPEDYYQYSMVLKINGRYTESNHWMNKFADQKPNDLRVLDYRANKSKFAGLLIDNPELYIEHQTMNTDALDFGTAFYDDQVVFASTRTHRKLFVSKYNWTHQPFWSMYISEVEDGQLKTPVRFAKALNGNLHDGPVSMSKQNTYMAFTRNHYRDKSKDGVVELQIWFSSLDDGKWSKPEPFTHNNSAYSVAHPWLSADGKTMFFASDKPGGSGAAIQISSGMRIIINNCRLQGPMM